MQKTDLVHLCLAHIGHPFVLKHMFVGKLRFMLADGDQLICYICHETSSIELSCLLFPTLNHPFGGRV